MASGSFNLTRTSGSTYLSFPCEWSSTSNTAGNYSDLTLNVYVSKGSASTSDTWGTADTSGTVDGQKKTNNGLSFRVAPGKKVLLFSKSYKINHNADGSKNTTISVNVGGNIMAANGSKSIALDKIPRQANLTAAPNFNDEENPTISYSNPAGDVVEKLEACISLDGSKDDISYRDISKTGTSYTFQLTEAERNLLRQATTDANNRKIRFYIQTTIGGVEYRNYLEKTLTIVNASPTLYPIIEDTNEYVVSLTGKASKLVKYFSSPLVETGSAAKKGASITNNAISNGNKHTTKASDTFHNVDNAIFIFWAKDSRGNEISQEINKINEGNWLDYVKITCNVTPTNPTTDGKMTLNISGNYWNGNFGAVANYLTLQYRMAVVGTDFADWVTIPAELNGNTYNASVAIEGLDYQTTYKFEVRAIDKLETTPTRYFEIQTTPVFDWGKNDFSFNVPVNNLSPLPMDLPDGNGDAEYWRNLKPGIYWYDETRFNVGGMPSGWGFVVKMGFVGNDFNIMYYTQAEGSIFRRSGNLTSDSGWKELLYKS